MKIERNREKLLGKEFKTLTSGSCFIIDYKGTYNVTVEFKNPHYICNTTMSRLNTGKVKNRLLTSVCGKGFIGEGIYNSSNSRPLYNLWKGMITRCYTDSTSLNLEVYKDVTVCDEWLDFQNFAEWCNKQKFFNAKDDKGKSYQLDKDLLVKGNKVYSPETCCFVPSQINSLFTYVKSTKGEHPVGVSYMKSRGKFEAYYSNRGKRVNLSHFNTCEEAFQAYKTAKEAHIKELANEWKDRIDGSVYQALLNYKVHIDD